MHSHTLNMIEFDGAKWIKGIEIVGCGNEKDLELLKITIHDLDELFPEMR